MTHPWNHSLTNIFSSPILLPQTYFNQRVCPFHIIPQISRPKWRKSQNHKTKPNGNIINAWSLTLTGCSMLSSNAKFPGQLHHSPKLPFQTLPALPRPPTLSPHSWKMIMALLHKEERVIQKLLYILCHKTYIFTCTSTILSLSLNINHLLPSAPKQTNKQTPNLLPWKSPWMHYLYSPSPITLHPCILLPPRSPVVFNEHFAVLLSLNQQ